MTDEYYKRKMIKYKTKYMNLKGGSVILTKHKNGNDDVYSF